MRVSPILKQIYYQAPIVNGLLMFSIIALSLGMSSTSVEKGILSFLPFLMMNYFIGTMLGRYLLKLMQTYLWSTNIEYRQSLNRAISIIPIVILFGWIFMVFSSSRTNELIVLLGLILMFNGIFATLVKESEFKIWGIVVPLPIVIGLDWGQHLTKYLILLLMYYVVS